MLQKQLDNKISKLLKIGENIDVSPPQENGAGYSVQIPSPFQNSDITEILKKQTELIELIKAQNELIKELLSAPKQQPLPPTVQQQSFQEKIIDIRFDDKGNPIGAEIKLKPSKEETLDLEELESQSHLALNIPYFQGNKE